MTTSLMSGQTVAIQIGAPSFVDEGVETCLDTLENQACVNTLFAMTCSYKERLSGRPSQRVDHGRQERGPKFHGGYYAALHPSITGTPFSKTGSPRFARRMKGISTCSAP